MSRYDVASANTNRTVRFMIEATVEGQQGTNVFGMLRGRNNDFPFYGQNSNPTALDKLAQLRTNAVVKAVTAYAPLVGVELAAGSDDGAAPTATAAPALIVTFEVDQFGAFYNNDWALDPIGEEKHLVTDIADTVGVGGMNHPKTKDGLSSLLDTVADISFDGGLTTLFGAGTITLPDGTQTAGAATLAGGLTITYIGQ